MKNRIFAVAAMAMAMTVVAAPVCLAQTRGVDMHGAALFEGRPFVTDSGVYNGYDLGGSPLGLFDAEQSRLSVGVGYRYYGLGDEVGHYLSGQSIRMGDPGRGFFEVFYGPDFLSYKGDGGTVSLPLHRFGLTLATQIADGLFGAALSTEGYIGTQTWESGDSSRYLWGIPTRLRIDVRSQVHPLLRVGVYGNVTIRYDTLHVPSGGHEDFWAQVNLPDLGGSVDFGGEGMPVRSNLSISYASSGFAYRSSGAGGTPPTDNNKRANAIMNDSLRLFWMTQAKLPVGGDYAVKPGLLFGYFANSGGQHVPSADNYPINLGDLIANSKYELNALYVGGGAGFEALQYADVYVEYTASLWSLNWERSYGSAGEKSRNLHHTAFGVSTKLHEYIDMPLKVTPRIAYFISGSAGVADTRHSSFEPMNVVSGKSRRGLYEPQFFLDGFERTSGFTFGIDGQALDGKLSMSYYMTFLSKNTVSTGGMELGLSAGFSL